MNEDFELLEKSQKQKEQDKALYWDSPRGRAHYEQILFRLWLRSKGLDEEELADDTKATLFQQFLKDK